MPKVPTLSGPTETSGIRPGVDFSPLARAARGTAEAGAALQDVGNAAAGVAVREAQRLSDLRIKQADTAFVNEQTRVLNDPESGYFSMRGENAINGYGAALEALETAAQTGGEGLKGRARETYDLAMQQRLNAARRAMGNHLRAERERFEVDTVNARLSAAQNQAVANYTDAGMVRQAFITADAELDDLGEAQGWSPEVRAEKGREFRGQVHGAVLDLLVGDNPTKARDYLKANRDDLSARVIVAAERSIDAEVKRRRAEAQRQQALVQAETSAALTVGILEGTVSRDVLDEAYEAGRISPSSWAGLRKAYDVEEEKRAKEADVFAIVAAGGPLDPGDKDHREAVGSIFKAAGGIEGLTSKSPEVATQTAEIAESTGIVPPQAVAIVRGAIASGDDSQREYAFDLVGRLDEIAPKALQRAFSAEDLTEALTYNKLTRAGVSDAQAMESINASRTMDQGTRDARRREGAELFEELAKGAGSWIDPGIESAFFNPSSLPLDQGDLPTFAPLADRIIDDARAVYLDAFVRSGDAEVATDVTRRTLARTYGRSEVAGSGDVMQYPPEAFYEIPGIENDWMREQLLEDVKAVAPKATPDGIELVPTPRTASDVRAGLAPRYQVLVRDENGIYEPVRDDDGKPMDYRFDPSRLIEARRVELEAKREKFVRTETLNAETSDALGVTNAEGFGDAL
jgi:hypothetical protein